jgi:hypothetical protein
MLLGDGCLSVDSRHGDFRLAHSPEQRDYLHWKTQLIEEIFREKVIPKRFRFYYPVYKLSNGKSYPGVVAVLHWKKYLGKYLYPKLYPNGKKSAVKLLKQISSDLHLAIWFMDDGSEVRRKPTTRKDGTEYICNPYLSLHTQSYTEGENKLICEWFTSHYAVTPRISNERKGCRLWWRVPESRELFKRIAPYVAAIPSMNHKFRLSLERYWFERPSATPPRKKCNSELKI